MVGLRALILAHRGDASAALALAAEAVATAEGTGITIFLARVLEDLADVRVLAGHPGEAAPPLTRAIELYDRKGVTVLAARARQKQAALPA
jgi:hypothetical protein